MEPKRSMSAYAACLVLALSLLCLAGFATAAVWSAISFFAVASAFWLERTHLLAHGRRGGRNSPPHRRRLDRLVRAQFLGSSLLGLAIGLVALRLSFHPFVNEGRFLRAMIVGAAVGVLGVFVSSLVDWNIILPKVSGLAGPAPCECVAGESWKYTTDLWYFHRAAATAVVYLVATGIPGFMSFSSSGSAAVAWGVVTTAVLLLAGYFFRGIFLASIYSINPPVLVGDLIWIAAPGDGDEDRPILYRRAYIVDVSLQGAKYKLLENGRYRGGKFVQKSDGTVTNESLLEAKKVSRKDTEAPLCVRGSCSGVNWYCRHNSAAHD